MSQPEQRVIEARESYRETTIKLIEATVSRLHQGAMWTAEQRPYAVAMIRELHALVCMLDEDPGSPDRSEVEDKIQRLMEALAEREPNRYLH